MKTFFPVLVSLGLQSFLEGQAASATVDSPWRDVDPDRGAVLIPAISAVSPIDPKVDYDALIEKHFERVATERGDLHSGVATVHRHLEARLYALRYRINGNDADAQRAMKSILDDLTSYDQGGAGFQAGMKFGPIEFSSAARAVWHLKTGGAFSVANDVGSTRRDEARRWLEMIYRRYDNKEQGPMNRGIPLGMGLQVLLGLSTEPLAGERAKQAALLEALWSQWHDIGDMAENATVYSGSNYQALTWWCQAREKSAWPQNQALKKMAYRVLDYATPLGLQPNFGDVLGFTSGHSFYIYCYEAWGRAYQDPSFRYEARKQMDYLQAEWDSADSDKVFDAHPMLAILEAVLDADTTLTPTAGAPGSVALDRARVGFSLHPAELDPNLGAREPHIHLQSEQVPDKVIFRTGREPGASYAMVAANRQTGHDHWDAGGITSYFSHGSLMLTSPSYLLKQNEYHNAFYVESDVADGPQNSTAKPLTTHNTGARLDTLGMGSATRLIISFDAKSLSGSRYLNIGRAGGGAKRSGRVHLTREWERYEETVEYVQNYREVGLLLTPVLGLAHDSGFDRTPAPAELLIDNLTIRRADGSELASFSFDQNADRFLGMIRLDTTPSLVFHEPSDGVGGNGALGIRQVVATALLARTDSIEREAFSEFQDFGYTRLRMEEYAGRPLDLKREIVFLGDEGIWVRDSVTAKSEFAGALGPMWHPGYVYGERGEHWVNGAQLTLPVTAFHKPGFATEWPNRPRDLLLQFKGGASAAVEDRDFSEYAFQESIRHNTTRDAVWFHERTRLAGGESRTFNTLLRPHAPTHNAANHAERVRWLADEADFTVVEIRSLMTSSRRLVGFNPTQKLVLLPTSRVKTDATVFQVTFDADGVAAYDLVATKILEVDGTRVFERVVASDVHSRDRVDETPGDIEVGGAASLVALPQVPPNPNLVELKARQDGEGRAFRVQVQGAPQGTERRLAHGSGVNLYTDLTDELSPVHVRFDARTESGGARLNVQRTYGGSDRASHPLTSEWRRYHFRYDPFMKANAAPIFSIVDGNDTSLFPVAESGVFWLDKLHVSRQPNRVLNPTVAESVRGFRGYRKSIASGDMTIFESVGAFDDGSGLLRVQQTGVAGFRADRTGVLVATTINPAHQPVRIKFQARRTGEAKDLRVGIPWAEEAGAAQWVTLHDQFQTYSLELTSGADFSGLWFTLCSSADPNVAVDGDCLLDSLIVTPVTNLASNPSLDDDVHGYSAVRDGLPDHSQFHWSPEGALVATSRSGNEAASTGIVIGLANPELNQPHSGYRLRFDAQSVSGSTRLRVGAKGSSEEALVTLTTDRYQRHVVDIPTSGAPIQLTIVDPTDPERTSTGSWKLDNVYLSTLP